MHSNGQPGSLTSPLILFKKLPLANSKRLVPSCKRSFPIRAEFSFVTYGCSPCQVRSIETSGGVFISLLCEEKTMDYLSAVSRPRVSSRKKPVQRRVFHRQRGPVGTGLAIANLSVSRKELACCRRSTFFGGWPPAVFVRKIVDASSPSTPMSSNHATSLGEEELASVPDLTATTNSPFPCVEVRSNFGCSVPFTVTKSWRPR